MERFKVVERETKTKAYSKEGEFIATICLKYDWLLCDPLIHYKPTVSFKRLV